MLTFNGVLISDFHPLGAVLVADDKAHARAGSSMPDTEQMTPLLLMPAANTPAGKPT